MSLSIERFSKRFTRLLAITTTGALVAGIWLLVDQQRLADSRFDAESRERVAGTAILLSKQIRFYRRILDDLAADRRLASLLDNGREADIIAWAERATGFLPGSLGAALALPGGQIVGNPPSMRVGEICNIDLQRFAHLPGVTPAAPVHRGVPELEHFDLYQKIRARSDEPAGTLMISFGLGPFRRLLDERLEQGQRYRLFSADGKLIARTSRPLSDGELRSFREPVAGTDWTLELSLPPKRPLAVSSMLAVVGLLLLGVLAVSVFYLSQSLLHRVKTDLRRLHQALLEVGNGELPTSLQPLGLKESRLLMNEIDTLAERMRTHQHLLVDDIHRDPLTGLFDRRYFEVMLIHEHLTSDQARPMYLAMIDLNNLGEVNADYGHATGDALLQVVARFLVRHVRRSDTVARLGSDRFALLLRELDTQAMESWLRHLVTAFGQLEQPQCQSDGDATPCTLAIGAARLDARLQRSAYNALDNAERALETAKQRRQEGSVIVIHRAERPVPPEARNRPPTVVGGRG